MNRHKATNHPAEAIVIDAVLWDELGLDLARLGDEDVVEIPYSKLRKALLEAFRGSAVAGRHWRNDE